ncbi:hypothetical protein FB451DRAFT_1245978 [Mycena latifolia]|nr:hypothetical protein FB451DRAFT_1245978 [Mycena latifolia]
MTSTPRSVIVEIHCTDSTEDCSEWPPDICRIFRTVERPLPSWCAAGPHQFVSNQVLPLLSELPPSLDADSYDEQQQRLADVFNLVLSTVSDIRALLAQYGPSRSALSFVSNLVRVLAHMCAEDSIIMYFPPHILTDDLTFLNSHDTPFTPEAHELDGVATLLACHAVEKFPSACSSPIDIEAERSDASLPSVYPMSVDSESECSTLGTPSIDVPLDAYVLPGRGRHISAELPFLCFADDNNIVDLMSSVACQRRVWGISRPVVGFVLSKSDTLAKLVLSWVDPATSIVHIACTTAKQAALGAFDFTNVVSALSFARLILDFSPDFSFISQRATAGCENNRLDWRSDNISAEESGCSRDRVSRWVHDVKISSGKPLSLPPTPPSSQQGGPSEDAMSKEKSTTKKNKSSSSFAKISVDNMENPEGNTLLWMFDRYIQTLGRIPFPTPEETEEEKLEVNEMISSYDKMCGLRCVKDKRQIPPVDAVLSPIRDLLIEELSTGLPECDLLESKHEDLLLERLSALLSAVVGAYTLKAKRDGLTVYEAESRHDWDALFYHFYTQSGEIISPHVMLERQIYFPRNDLVDEIDQGDPKLFIESQQTRAENSLDLCSEAEKAARTIRRDTPSVHSQATAAVVQAADFLRLVGNLQRDPRELEGLVRTRSKVDPVKGQCDALLFISIPRPPHFTKEAEIILFASATDAAEPSAPTTVTSDAGAPKMKDTSASKAGSKASSTTGKAKPDAASLQNPFFVSAIQLDVVRASLQIMSKSFKGHLLLPHATAEYKKKDDTDGKALNQGRMYLISVVSYYAVLGIMDYPFYCLVTSGHLGAILMAWKSTKQNKIYVMERNIYTFDITSPLQAFQFATFLLRLRLKAGLDAKIAKKLSLWRKETQALEEAEKEKAEKERKEQAASSATRR